MERRTNHEIANKSCHATLATPAAKEIAQKKGIADPQKSEACVKCHNAEGPTFKGFDFAEYSKKFAHPTPKQQGITFDLKPLNSHNFQIR
jgi:hypothetical protein